MTRNNQGFTLILILVAILGLGITYIAFKTYSNQTKPFPNHATPPSQPIFTSPPNLYDQQRPNQTNASLEAPAPPDEINWQINPNATNFPPFCSKIDYKTKTPNCNYEIIAENELSITGSSWHIEENYTSNDDLQKTSQTIKNYQHKLSESGWNTSTTIDNFEISTHEGYGSLASSFGYIKSKGTEIKIIYFSTGVKPASGTGWGNYECPCQANNTIFISDTFNLSTLLTE